MKLYFHVPGKALYDGLMFLNEDSRCVQMAEYTCVGGEADIYVEYHGEEDSEDSLSGSDFENDELLQLSDDDEPAIVISADVDEHSEELVMVPDDTGVITQVICSPVKQGSGMRRNMFEEQVRDAFAGSQVADSQVVNPSQVPTAGVPSQQVPEQQAVAVARDPSRRFPPRNAAAVAVHRRLIRHGALPIWHRRPRIRAATPPATSTKPGSGRST